MGFCILLIHTYKLLYNLFTPSTYASLTSKEKICVKGPRWSEMNVFFSYIGRRNLKYFPNGMKLGRIIAREIPHFLVAVSQF